MERWKINLYVLWFSQVLSMMSFNFGIPFIPFYIKELGVTGADDIKLYTAILGAAPAISMAVMSPVWGIAADRWGKKLMLLRAMFTAAFIIAGMGLAANVNQLVVMRLLQGIFTGTITAAFALVAFCTPTNRLTYALGFLSSSTFIGSSIGPVIGGFLAENAGYRISFYLGGALMLIDFLIVLFLVREELPAQAAGVACTSPGNEGPDVKNVNTGAAIDAKTSGKSGSLALMMTGFMIIMLFLLLALKVSRALFSPYLPLYVEERTTANAASTTGIINGVTGFVTALSGLTLSRLGDKYNKNSLIRLLLALSLIAAIPLGFISNLWVFTIVYSLVFFLGGAIEPVMISITTERTPVEKRGMLFGVQGFVGNFAWFIAPLAASYVSIHFSIQAALFLVPLSLLPACVAVYLFRKKLEANG